MTHAVREGIDHLRHLVPGHGHKVRPFYASANGDAGLSSPPETPKRQDTEESKIGLNKADPKYQGLKATFNMIDSDKKGWINAKDLMDMLEFRGIRMTETEAATVIRMYSQNDHNQINFSDFVCMMRDCEGADLIDFTRAFVKRTTSSVAKGDSWRRKPSIDSSHHGPLMDAWNSEHEHNARLEVSKIVDASWVHAIILAMIFVDVVCVIMELLLHATRCVVPGTSGTSSASGKFCNSCSQKQQDWETVLHSISVSILILFALQILFVMCTYRMKFFRNKFFVLDAVVIGGALILELGFHVKEGVLLVVLLLWRCGRICHGLLTTLELGHKTMHSKINKVLLAQNEKKAGDMKDLKVRMREVNVAKGDLELLRNLLKPTALTVDSVDGIPPESLRRMCKFQIMNNHDVLEAFATFAKDLKTIETHIENHIEDAAEEAERIGSKSSHPLEKVRPSHDERGRRTTRATTSKVKRSDVLAALDKPVRREARSSSAPPNLARRWASPGVPESSEEG